jgi:hypothetical protein
MEREVWEFFFSGPIRLGFHAERKNGMLIIHLIGHIPSFVPFRCIYDEDE